jgi:putative transposase
VYLETLEQRFWVYKTRNVLDELPKRLQVKAKDLMHGAMQAPNRHGAERAIGHFSGEFEDANPKAVDCVTDRQVYLLTFSILLSTTAFTQCESSRITMYYDQST